MNLSTSNEFLRTLIAHKTKKEWHQNIENSWKDERWFKAYQKRNKDFINFKCVTTLPNGFFQFFGNRYLQIPWKVNGNCRTGTISLHDVCLFS